MIYTNRRWNETHTRTQLAYDVIDAYDKNHASGVELTSKIRSKSTVNT